MLRRVGLCVREGWALCIRMGFSSCYIFYLPPLLTERISGLGHTAVT